MARDRLLSSRDIDNAARLELPLLLALDGELQSLQDLQRQVGHDRNTLRKALSCLCSKGLALRKETIEPAKFTRLANGEFDVKKEKIFQYWKIHQRGINWRETLIDSGKLEKIDHRYAKVAERYRIRAEKLKQIKDDAYGQLVELNAQLREQLRRRRKHG